jgi:hypothetical protein
LDTRDLKIGQEIRVFKILKLYGDFKNFIRDFERVSKILKLDKDLKILSGI